mmetsp:Transcript_27342/g.89497  ORF Transcript_27342/g.89497 Transcript_27342/m.89497 type:complete len:466 (+) Transcript_27342:463-1860(+)
MADDEHVRAGVADALDKFVELALRRAVLYRLQIREESLLLLLKELLPEHVPFRVCGFVVEAADVHFAHFGRLENLAQAPHQGTIDAEELLGVDGVSFIEDDAHFIVVSAQRRDDGFEFVGDVELVRVEEEQNDVAARDEPLANLDKVVGAVEALLVAAQHAGGVDESDFVEQRVRALRRLKLGQERGAEGGQTRERQGRLHHNGVAGSPSLVVAVDDNHEAVRRGLRTDVRARVVLLQQRFDEGRLPRRVLSEQQNHRAPVKVALRENLREKVAKLVRLLDGLELCKVEVLEAVHHGRALLLGEDFSLAAASRSARPTAAPFTPPPSATATAGSAAAARRNRPSLRRTRLRRLRRCRCRFETFWQARRHERVRQPLHPCELPAPFRVHAREPLVRERLALLQNRYRPHRSHKLLCAQESLASLVARHPHLRECRLVEPAAWKEGLCILARNTTVTVAIGQCEPLA